MLPSEGTSHEMETLASNNAELPAQRAAGALGSVFLESSRFPFRELSLIIARDRRSHDPVYSMHRWWARRPPSLMRALLMSSVLPATQSENDFWEKFASEDHLLSGLRVYDPFMGGGSTLVEAARLGAHIHGGDVDPMAVTVTRRALEPAPASPLREAGNQMIQDLKSALGHFYPESSLGTPLHYFSIAEVNCSACDKRGALYKNLVLVRDSGKSGAVVRNFPLTVFCPCCFELHEIDSAERGSFRCCGHVHQIAHGTFSKQLYNCPHCGTRSRHRDLRTGVAPRRLIAIEETSPNARRTLRSPEQSDIDIFHLAEDEWTENRDILPHPSKYVHAARHDERPRSYGIERYEQMFTHRQLLILGSARKWLMEEHIESEVKGALELALSNALTTNNRLCGYATDYGRLSALFTVRGYSLPALSVELNPLHEGGGRGTLAACVERVARSAEKQVQRHVWSLAEHKAVPRKFEFYRNGGDLNVAQHDAEEPPSPNQHGVMDVMVFDPPYFDYIAYDELSEFYRAWTDDGELAGEPLMPVGENKVQSFGKKLGKCLQAMILRLKTGLPLTFTYHATEREAWEAIGIALDYADLRVTSLWPIRSDGNMGHHSYPGSSEWDVVVVCRPINDTVGTTLPTTAEDWIAELHPLHVNVADTKNFQCALEIAFSRYGSLNGGG